MTSQIKNLLDAAAVDRDLAENLCRNELGDAELFADLFVGKAVFDHAERRWFLWDGFHWRPDVTDQVFGMVGSQLAGQYLTAAAEARKAGNHAESDRYVKRAAQLWTLSRIRNVLELASKQAGIGITGSEWDIKPMILPVENGVVGLNRGEFRAASASDYLRVFVPTRWRGLEHPAPRWEDLLLQIFGGDRELIAFFQRLVGYAISGDTSEQILGILCGGGSNGKSTLVDILSAVLGPDFSWTIQADVLMDSGRPEGNGAKPFIVALRNKRIVWASESREGGRLNSGLIKQLTGDGQITARGLYSLPVTFKQTHTIMLVTNHRPSMPGGGDEAIWRRVLMVPFSERFVESPAGPHEHRRIKGALSAILEEAAGILAWIVRGCLAWQASGLNPPISVLDSTTRYRQDEDLVSQFAEDRLIQSEDLELPAGDLYRAYTSWCEDLGHRPFSAKAFGQRMTSFFGEAIVKRAGAKARRTYRGVGLRQ